MISVIIPTYKNPEILDLCLRSAIEGQLISNQIIVVVDGFYDLNKEVLEKWAKHIDYDGEPIEIIVSFYDEGNLHKTETYKLNDTTIHEYYNNGFFNESITMRNNLK